MDHLSTVPVILREWMIAVSYSSFGGGGGGGGTLRVWGTTGGPPGVKFDTRACVFLANVD
jgi:hypothetical protein